MEKDVKELPGASSGYLLKNEPEFKKEVYGIMRPLIVLQSERMESITERHMNAIRKLIEKFYSSGLSRQEVKESIQDIFSLSEDEAEEQVGKCWKQKEE